MGLYSNKRVRGQRIGKRKLTDSPKGVPKGYEKRGLIFGKKNSFSKSVAKSNAKKLRAKGWLVRVLPMGKTGNYALYTRRNDKCFA
tara:strand:- start:49 stop:306 length:258 start_codon:yes stop_codon:yes gene_type:complete